jgi:ATP-dependent 26S proteasome regulatory subunit
MSGAGAPTTSPPADETDWFELNRRSLSAEVAIVAARLRLHAFQGEDPGPAKEDVEAAGQRADEARQRLPADSALEVLTQTFGLSAFERDLVALCAGVELEGQMAALCAEAQGDGRKAYPTFGLALAALPDGHWSALAPTGPLRRWQLLDVGQGGSLTSSPLTIDERVLHYLAGVYYLDERLQGLVRYVSPPAGELAPSHGDVALRVARLWSSHGYGEGFPLVHLWGPDRVSIRSVAAAACAAIGVQLHRLDASDIPATPRDRATLARLWEREATLAGCALLIDVEGEDAAEERHRAAASFLDELFGMVVLVTQEPVAIGGRVASRINVGELSVDERRGLWSTALGPAADRLDGEVDAVVEQFHVGARDIWDIASEVRAAVVEDSGPSQEHSGTLWQACRAQARPRLDDLAQRIELAATWQDLVVPEPQAEVLREVVAQVRQRIRVYEDWGFAARTKRGLGISALFAGPSGTGKTMAAEVLANELGLDLYRIDLSQVVNKYIGETEKRLKRLFDAAEGGGAVLLFDEADALFGKRSEVKDSHDRYANIEVSYLLQRMETYRGLAILTTNMRNSLDTAFTRRLRFVLQFPFPDHAQRAEIWRRVFPSGTPLEPLDVETLARLNVTGGNIRNIAMNAAFLAASEGVAVGMSHLFLAIRREYAKLEKSLTDAEVRGVNVP